MKDAFLLHTEHRPWPVPNRRWIWRQRWDQVLFLHWRVSEARLSALLPAGLDVDTHDGSAWISLVPFRMANVRPRGLFPLGSLSNFLELNLRTYVRAQGRPGVYFLRVLAGNRASAWLGKTLSPLPYEFAPIRWAEEAGGVHFEAPGFAARFSPGEPIESTDAEEHWLTERYCMYANSSSRILRADVHHRRWPLRQVSARIETNDLLGDVGVAASTEPDAVHYSPGVEIVGWSAETV